MPLGKCTRWQAAKLFLMSFWRDTLYTVDAMPCILDTCVSSGRPWVPWHAMPPRWGPDGSHVYVWWGVTLARMAVSSLHMQPKEQKQNDFDVRLALVVTRKHFGMQSPSYYIKTLDHKFVIKVRVILSLWLMILIYSFDTTYITCFCWPKTCWADDMLYNVNIAPAS